MTLIYYLEKSTIRPNYKSQKKDKNKVLSTQDELRVLIVILAYEQSCKFCAK